MLLATFPADPKLGDAMPELESSTDTAVPAGAGTTKPASESAQRDPIEDAAVECWVVRVLRLPDHEPLAAAQVRVSEWRGLEGPAAPASDPMDGVTGDDGRCRFRCSAAAQIALTVTRDGYVPTADHLRQPRSGQEIVLVLATEAVDSVLVVNGVTGAPMPEASVFVEPAKLPVVRNRSRPSTQPPCFATQGAIACDAIGVALIRGRTPGFYDVRATAPGMLTGHGRGVELPFPSSPLRIELMPGHSIEAIVVNRDGPVGAGWEVIFSGETQSWSTTTDTDGRALSPGYADGDVVVVSVARKDLDPMARLTEAFTRPISAAVTVPVADPVRLLVSEGRALPVTVRWPVGSETDELEIQLLQPIGPDSNGLAQSARVRASAGEIVLGATASVAHARFVVQAVGSISGLWRSDVFAMNAAGPTTIAIHEVQARSGLLVGHAWAGGRDPAPGCRVSLSAVPSGIGLLDPTLSAITVAKPIRESTTDAGGMFLFDALLPGNYTVEVAHPWLGVAMQAVRVVDGSEIELNLAAGGDLHGSVAHMPPAKRVRIAVRSKETAWSTETWVDPSGEFLLRGLVAGAYSVTLGGWPGGASAGPFGKPQAGPETTVVVVDGQQTTCSLDASATLRSLSVTCGDVGEPCEVHVERLHPFDRNGRQQWATDSRVPRSGCVVFDNLETHASYVVTLRRSASPAPLAWAEVRPGVTAVDLRATSVASLRVLDPPAALVLVPTTSADQLARDSVIQGTRAADGAYEFRLLPSGRYRAVMGVHPEFCGIVEKSMVVDLGAGDTAVRWHPAK